MKTSFFQVHEQVPSMHMRAHMHTVLALTNSNTLTCFVSERDFRFSRFCLFAMFFWKPGGEISKKNNKGVLDRPWTKWKVLMAISSTLKFQFTEHPES